MKKLNKVASLFATAALATSDVGRVRPSQSTIDNWVSGTRAPLEERHQRTVLARWLLDARHRASQIAMAR